MRWLLAPLLALILAPATLAASFSFSIVTTSPLTVPTVTLNGNDQTKTFSIVTQVAYTGFGNTAGWNVTASATAPTSGVRVLPALKVTAGSFACVTGCTTSPTNGIAFPIDLSTSAQKIYDAAASTGRGTFDVTSTYQATYPASAISGTYTSTVTLAGATGP